MIKSLSFLVAFFAVQVWPSEAAECEDLEIFILLDASDGFEGRKASVARELASALRTAETQASSVRTAVATFVDKPVPGVGYGDFGGYLSTGVKDWCYELSSEFTASDSGNVESLISSLSGGGGLDRYDGQWEGLTNALVDPAVEWSSNTRKTVIMVTDDLGHINLEGFTAAEKVDLFRATVVCADDNSTTTGGFGCLSPPVSLVDWTPKESEYYEYAELKNIMVCGQIQLYPDQWLRYYDLEEELKQVKWDALLPFDLESLKQDRETHCEHNEFPTYEQVAELLTDLDVQFIVVLVDNWSQTKTHSEPRGDQQTAAAWQWIFDNPLQNVQTSLITILEKDLAETGKLSSLVVEQLQGLNADGCTVPTTTESPEPNVCRDLELLFLIDASSSFAVRRDGLATTLRVAIARLEDELRSVRVGVASFVDKPIPEAAVGNYGGYLLENYQEDWCFELASPLVEGASEELESVINGLVQGGGLDDYDGQWEAMAEAMMRDDVDWSNTASRKVVVMITDGVGHINAPTFAGAEGMERFREPVTCVDGTTTGGFGALNPSVYALRLWTPRNAEYAEYAQLMNKTVCGDTLTDTEQTRMDELADELAETKLDSLLPFDFRIAGTDPLTHCAKHEFPTYPEVVTLMQGRSIQLIVVLVDTAGQAVQKSEAQVLQSPAPFASSQESWEWILSDPLANISSSLITLKANQVEHYLAQLLINEVEDLLPAECLPEEEPQVDVLFLVDTSVGFQGRAEALAHEIAVATQQLEAAVPAARTAVARFVDKPAPGLGVGNFGGYLVDTDAVNDTCYELASRFTSKAGSSMESLVASLQVGSGLDTPEAHWEALLNGIVDSDLEWKAPRKTVVMVTDDIGHVNISGLSGHESVDLFRAPVTCFGWASRGGFGATELPQSLSNLTAWTPHLDEYNEYAYIRARRDCYKPGASVDYERLAELEEYLQATTFNQLEAFDLELLRSDPDLHCAANEYPTYEDILQTVTASDFELIVVLIDVGNQAQAAWEWIFSSPLADVKHALVTVPEASLDTIASSISDYLINGIPSTKTN